MIEKQAEGGKELNIYVNAFALKSMLPLLSVSKTAKICSTKSFAFSSGKTAAYLANKLNQQPGHRIILPPRTLPCLCISFTFH